MLLSDRDLIDELKAGQLQLEPFDPALVQPSSIDVRLDRFFRVFNNHLYTHIDPAEQQDDLTSMVEVADGQPFVLHPGEFVLASTLEVITLGDQLAGRLEGKSSLGRLGLLTHSTAGFIDPGFSGHVAGTVERRQPSDQALARHEDRPALHLPPVVAGGAPIRSGRVRLPLPGPARPDRQPLVPQLAGLADNQLKPTTS